MNQQAYEATALTENKYRTETRCPIAERAPVRTDRRALVVRSDGTRHESRTSNVRGPVGFGFARAYPVFDD